VECRAYYAGALLVIERGRLLDCEEVELDEGLNAERDARERALQTRRVHVVAPARRRSIQPGPTSAGRSLHEAHAPLEDHDRPQRLGLVRR
jgi:hypothetical protein